MPTMTRIHIKILFQKKLLHFETEITIMILATILCIILSDTTQNHYNFLVAQPLVYRKSSIAPKSINPNICLRYGDKRFGDSKIVLFCIQYRVNRC